LFIRKVQLKVLFTCEDVWEVCSIQRVVFNTLKVMISIKDKERENATKN